MAKKKKGNGKGKGINVSGKPKHSLNVNRSNKKKKGKGVNVSGKPKHSLDVNRSNKDSKKDKKRSAATIRRLKMYNTKPNRNGKGKILSNEFQSKDLPSTRIQPDPRWFTNTRVVSQKDLEVFREEMQKRTSSNYNVILNENKLPLSLLKGVQNLQLSS